MTSFKRRASRGDTLVEMIFAFAILSLVVVGVMMIMNRGIRMSQESIEHTLVRQQMDGQAEMVRFIHDTDNPAWGVIKSKLSTDIMSLSTVPCPALGTISTSSKNAFFLTQSAPGTFAVKPIGGATYADPMSYAKIDYTAGKAYGLWLQIAKAENKASPTSPASALDAYDVYVHACWYGAGSGIPTTLGTIVRLYDQ